MEQISQICVVWGNAVALSRYHLSPHSTNLVGIRLLPEQRVQAPGNFNCDAPWAGRASEDRYRLYKLTNCLSRFGISGIDALGQGVLKMAELLFIARQYRRVERDGVVGRRFDAQPHCNLPAAHFRAVLSEADFREFGHRDQVAFLAVVQHMALMAAIDEAIGYVARDREIAE